MSGTAARAAEHQRRSERYLARRCAPLLELVRETLRANPYNAKREEVQHAMWIEQAVINMPILYLSSIYLYQRAHDRGVRRFLFATRDGFHWHKLFRQMYPRAKVHYFDCSRNMFERALKRRHSSYLRYVRGLCGDSERVVYADIHGSGLRVLKYFEQHADALPECLCFLISTNFKSASSMPSRCRESGVRPLVYGTKGSPIEMLNYDVVGTLQDYNSKGAVRAPVEYDVRHLRAYHGAAEAFLHASRALDSPPTLSRDELEEMIEYLFEPILRHSPALGRLCDPERHHPRS